jgi:hypothetical protein
MALAPKQVASTMALKIAAAFVDRFNPLKPAFKS